jgi:2-C-methyl-D-erythritol 2,4-cyclodiphosphate synthase
MSYRIGIGYDIHRLIEGRKLFLGGVYVPYAKGLLGHSDGDVLLHAVCDALLGAAAQGDIGELFPDTDPKYRDISSTELLKIVADKVRKKGFAINNIDAVVLLQEPRLTSLKKQMQTTLAQILDLKKDCVGIKAKTNEGLGEIGAKRAVACYAAVMLVSDAVVRKG